MKIDQKSSSYTKFLKKENMTGRVDILIFDKNAKKLKKKSQEQKNIVYGKSLKTFFNN